MKKAIKKREYFEIKLELISPLNIGNGESIETDSDVLKASDGRCFIPGTSLAGALRNYLGDMKNEESIYGFSQGDAGRMSSVFISDLYWNDEDVKLSVRDNVKLMDDKSVDNKFDMEIMEPGAIGRFRIETVERQGDEFDFDQTITNALRALNSGEIRLGANKNRGLGRVRILEVKKRSFTNGQADEWRAFLANDLKMDEEATDFEDWKVPNEKNSNKFIHVRVPLKLTGGISVRKYSAQPGKADYEHLSQIGKDGRKIPIIPGTSWNGAIRHDAGNILKELGMKEEAVREAMNKWFGTVKEGDAEGTNQSAIVISEGRIVGGEDVPMTRNKVDRFSAGTINGALYTELAHFEGDTFLEYMVPKEESISYKALLGLMEIVVKDICSGYLAVGGLTAVGRGVFTGSEEDIIYSESISNEECMEQLYEVVKGGMGV